MISQSAVLIIVIRRDRLNPSGRGRDFHATFRLSSTSETSEDKELLSNQLKLLKDVFPNSHRILILLSTLYRRKVLKK